VLYGARLARFIGACTVVVTACRRPARLVRLRRALPATAIMRLADVQLSFPFILLALTINAIVASAAQHHPEPVGGGWVVYARVYAARCCR